MSFSATPPFIGKYTMLSTVGSGAFSVVKKAKQADSDELVAIKCIPRETLVEESAVKRLERETLILNKLEHPNVVKILDFQADSHYVYLVMEYFDGTPLMDKFEKFDEEDAKVVIKQLLTTLDYLHSHNVAHRDIKPDNILVDNELHIKLIDFGFSREGDEQCRTYCGSPAYSAPEILAGRPYDAKRADMWSVGVMMYQILAGKLPWKMACCKDMIYQQIEDCKFSIPEYFSSDAADFIGKLLKKNEIDRLTAEDALNHPWIEIVKVKKMTKLCRSPSIVDEKLVSECIRSTDNVAKEKSPIEILQMMNKNMPKCPLPRQCTARRMPTNRIRCMSVQPSSLLAQGSSMNSSANISPMLNIPTVQNM